MVAVESAVYGLSLVEHGVYESLNLGGNHNGYTDPYSLDGPADAAASHSFYKINLATRSARTGIY